MRELVLGRDVGLLDHGRHQCLVDQFEQAIVVELGGGREQVVGELPPANGGAVQHVLAIVRAPVEPSAEGFGTPSGSEIALRLCAPSVPCCAIRFTTSARKKGFPSVSR